MELSVKRGEYMSNYGKTFRTFRKNKGYTLNHVANGIVSVSFLSKFERGDSSISFPILIELLDRIMVTYEEFYFLHHSGKSNPIEEFFNAAENAFAKRDLPAITQLKKEAVENYKQTNHVPYHCNVLLLEVYESMIKNKPIAVTNTSLQILTNYLFDIEVWGYYELRLYNSALFLLPAELVITFSEIVYKNSDLMKKLPVLHNVFTRVLLNTITYLTGGQNPQFIYEQECRTFITYLEESDIPETDLHARLALIQAKGYLDLRLGETNKGIESIQRVISIYEQSGSKKLALEATNYLHILLNNQKNRDG